MPSPVSLPISHDNIQCNLQERMTSLGYGLLSTAEAISRIVAGGLALLGYAATLGHWQEAYTFGAEQIQKAIHAVSASANHLYAMIWPQHPVSQPAAISGAKPECKEPPPPVASVLPTPQSNCRAKLIAAKLQRQFNRAQLQAATEVDKDFKYRVAPDGPFLSPWTDPQQNFYQHSDARSICGFETGFSLFSGRRDDMEDEYLTTVLPFTIKGKEHIAAVFGVFDGHVGKEAAVFVKENLEDALRATLVEFCAEGLTQESIRDALKETFRRLDKAFMPEKPGTTATVAMILDGHLWTANIGDSRIILDNGIQLTEDAKPGDPSYQKRIKQLGGYVEEIGGVPRVASYLSVARAIGDHTVKGICAEAKIIDFPLSELPANSHLILACDGIYDVASTRQIAKVVQDNKELSARQIAKNIVYSAYRSHSNDNLTALVVKL